jgi:hypothetical protein
MRLHFLIPVILIALLSLSCSPAKKLNRTAGKADITVVSNDKDSTEYEIIIIDPGFQSWFESHRKPEWYYSIEYLANWNNQYVTAWNIKYHNTQFQAEHPDSPFWEPIDYRLGVDYGMDVNYKLYNYFLYVEATWGRILPYDRRN